MKTFTQLSSHTLSLFALLLLSSQLTGCFVSVSDHGQDDDYYYEDVYSSSSSDESYLAEEIFEEEIFEEEITETVETTETTETTETITSTAPEGDRLVESQPVAPRAPDYLFEETFESPELAGIDRVSVSSLGQWAIEWTPGSRCEHLSGTGSVEIQSEVDVGNQFEVEGIQHARLDGRCGQDLNPARLVTSIAEVSYARTLSFYARVAETAPYAELMVEWNDEVVMNEALLDVWAEYTIDLTQTQNAQDAILTLTALNPGVLIDHIRIK